MIHVIEYANHIFDIQAIKKGGNYDTHESSINAKLVE
jgi:hypothetical protein